MQVLYELCTRAETPAERARSPAQVLRGLHDAAGHAPGRHLRRARAGAPARGQCARGLPAARQGQQGSWVKPLIIDGCFA